MDGRQRVVIERVRPQVDDGRYPIKQALGQECKVSADIFTDGHDLVAGRLLYRHASDEKWSYAPLVRGQQDRFAGSFKIEKQGEYLYSVQGWIDHFLTWQEDLRKRVDANQNVSVELQIGAKMARDAAKQAKGAAKAQLEESAELLENPRDAEQAVTTALSATLREMVDKFTLREWVTNFDRELRVTVDPPRAVFSSWYELFPRSYGDDARHGSFKDAAERLEEVAELGFDVVYLPPIHPIGRTKRKGPNNNPVATEGDPGSPWAIGAKEGGHKSIHPDLGTLEDFKDFLNKADQLGISVAIDLAYQCSHDHPYIKTHPEWFKWRPDKTIQYAENPPKKYEDVVPFNFETEAWEELWNELKTVITYWADVGVRIFRVDNPHTKPFPFWEWAIRETRKEYPDLIFLAEAFTRPSVKYRLAKLGFTQSYTYFTWRNTKHEIEQYMRELTQTDVRDYCRPNFWPNTPDILPEFLQYGGRPAFLIRIALAATLSSNYGIYGPAYELCVNEAVQGKEEYLHSEKYEIKDWDLDKPGNLKSFISELNRIRKENPALQETNNVSFHHVNNDYLLFFVKKTADLSNVVFVMVNLDPFHTQAGTVRVPLDELGLSHEQTYLVYDLMSDDKYIWQGEDNYVELNPHQTPVHIFRIHRRMRREADFDYYL